MINLERYKDEFIVALIELDDWYGVCVPVVGGKLKNYRQMTCHECDFNRNECAKEFTEWLLRNEDG